MAFFQPLARPRRFLLIPIYPAPRSLGWIVTVRTVVTCTPYRSSTARRTSILLARGLTSKVYLPSPARSVLFSLTTGRRRTSYVCIGQQPLQPANSVNRKDQDVVVQDVDDVESGSRLESHPG